MARALGISAAWCMRAGLPRGQAGAELQRRLGGCGGRIGRCHLWPELPRADNVHDKVMLYGASMPRELKPGPIGAVFQSGSTCWRLMNAGRDLRFSYLISSGNEAVLDSSDYFDFLVDDPGNAPDHRVHRWLQENRIGLPHGRTGGEGAQPIIL